MNTGKALPDILDFPPKYVTIGSPGSERRRQFGTGKTHEPTSDMDTSWIDGIDKGEKETLVLARLVTMFSDPQYLEDIAKSLNAPPPKSW